MSNIQSLRNIMQQLRDPETGCPWDLEQDFPTIAKHTIEEAYEVAEKAEARDLDGLCEELGDLLLQVVFYSQMAEEVEAFSFEDVVDAICAKLIRRHPHIFGESKPHTAKEQEALWEQLKEEERKDKKEEGMLSGVASNFPALMRAYKLQKRAAKEGFDWPNVDGAYAKLEEEIRELKEASNKKHQEEELGDLLFSAVNISRKLGIDPEEALRKTNQKFMARIAKIEAQLDKEKKTFSSTSLEELDKLWEQVK